MKAYYLSVKDNDDAGQEIVFANTAKEAKRLVSGNIWDNLENYLDLRVNRAKKFDGMENLDSAHLALEQWKWGWQWFDMDFPDPDEATDEEFIKWYEESF
jgi:hypothetical protein